MLMDAMIEANGFACWRMDSIMACLRVASKASGSWKESVMLEFGGAGGGEGTIRWLKGLLIKCRDGVARVER